MSGSAAEDRRRGQRRIRPTLMALEDRRLLSAFTVAKSTGHGVPRWVAIQSNGPASPGTSGPQSPGAFQRAARSPGRAATNLQTARVLGSAQYFAKVGASNPAFINSVYQDVLGRGADSAEAAYWGGALNAGANRTRFAYTVLTRREPARLDATGGGGQGLGGGAAPAGPARPRADTPTPADRNDEIDQSYIAWKAAYVTASGAGGFLRVQRPSDNNDTVSEGIGYGMILAAYQGDRTTFDGLWSYAKSHFDANGLMNWQIDANNQTIGFNAATDGDEDMAMALIKADGRWGGYTADAKALIGNIMAHEIEPNTWVVKPGDVWGGSSVLNPSYFAPAYYRLFAGYTGDANWNLVVSKVYTVLDAIDAKNNGTGLVPDWSDAAGNPAPGKGYNYTYDATRTPWRLAVDYNWYGDAQAKAQLDKINAFFQGVGVAQIKDGYQITGPVIGQWHNAAFVAPVGAASTASTDAAYRAACWQDTVALTNGGYYNDSLRLLGMLVMGGEMTKPA